MNESQREYLVCVFMCIVASLIITLTINVVINVFTRVMRFFGVKRGVLKIRGK